MARHTLLARQIRRHFGSEEAVPADWSAFLGAVDEAYRQSDADRAMLERSMDLSSRELMQAHAELHGLFRAIPDLFFRFDADGTILDCRAGDPADLYVLPPARLIGRQMQRIPVPEVGEQFAEAIRQVQATRSMVRIEYSLDHGGQRHHYEARLLPLDRSEMMTIIRNITEQKVAEEALRQSLSLLQATLDSTADGILVVDLEGRIVAYNRRFVQMWRIPDELMQSGKDELALAFVLDQLKKPESFLAKVRELYAQPEAESQDVLEFKDGRVFERYSQPQRIGDRCVGRVWSFSDVTERRRSEEERSRLQTMSALGHLVGGLAHEVRNPLFAISGTLEALLSNLREAPQNQEMRRCLDNLREPTARLTELMSDLLEYGKPLSPHLSEGALDDVVRQAVADCTPLAESKRVRLSLQLGERKHPVGMIQRRLLVALTNLIQNAVQHTPPDGTVLVDVEEIGEEGCAWARCNIRDSGTGFQDGDLPRIFEPFVTRRRGGTGLGLSIVQRIVEEHRARIVAANRPEGGAIITVDFPRLYATGKTDDLRVCVEERR